MLKCMSCAKVFVFIYFLPNCVSQEMFNVNSGVSQGNNVCWINYKVFNARSKC